MKLLIYTQTSKVAIASHTYWACDYLSMLGLKLIYVSKRELWECGSNL